MFNQVKTGEIDILPAVAYSKQRDQLIDYNYRTVIANWAELYTSEEVELNSFLELQDKVIAVKAGDIHFAALKKTVQSFNIECRFLETDEYKTTFEMLRAGVADVAVVNRLYGEKKKLNYAARGTSVLFNPIEMRYAFPQDKNQNISHTIDTYIEIFKADKSSIYYKTFNKWLVVEPDNEVPRWLLHSLYTVIGIAFFLIATSMLFRKQVRNRTSELQQANEELVDQISERHNAEATLQKYARVIEASSDAIALLTCDNKHIFTNESYRAIRDTPSNSLEGTSVIDFLGEDFFNLELKEAVALCLRGETVHVQTRPRAGHANEFYWNLTLTPYYSATNNLEGYVMDIHDVTEQVELQNRLKNSQKMDV